MRKDFPVTTTEPSPASHVSVQTMPVIAVYPNQSRADRDPLCQPPAQPAPPPEQKPRRPIPQNPPAQRHYPQDCRQSPDSAKTQPPYPPQQVQHYTPT